MAWTIIIITALIIMNIFSPHPLLLCSSWLPAKVGTPWQAGRGRQWVEAKNNPSGHTSPVYPAQSAPSISSALHCMIMQSWSSMISRTKTLTGQVYGLGGVCDNVSVPVCRQPGSAVPAQVRLVQTGWDQPYTVLVFVCVFVSSSLYL